MCDKHNLPMKFGFPLYQCSECRNQTLKTVKDKIDPSVQSFEAGDVVNYFDNNYILEKISDKEAFLKTYVHNPVEVEDLIFVSRKPRIDKISKDGKKLLSKLLDFAIKEL